MPLVTGSRLGPYEIVMLVGSGGMGEVYKARDTRLDRTVAIKVLSRQFAIDAGRRARFEREARAVAALNHPHICSLYDVGEVPSLDSPASNPDSIPFLVIEHLEGQTLADRLVRGALATRDVLRYAVELADALDHAHRRGLVHRDLKPGNVMLTKGGAKLLDFGLSRLQSSPDLLKLSTIVPGPVPLTAEGTVLGTYPYMAPEQLAGHEADVRSDLFAFGATVYEMATGRRAFEGTTAATLIGAILHTDPPPISALQPLTPPGLDRLVSRCLAKDPDDRWQTARDLMLELKWIAGQTAPSPVTVQPRIVSLGRMAVAALSVVVLAAAAFTVSYGRRGAVAESAVRFTFSPPDGLTLSEVATGGDTAISPDGERVAFVGTAADGKELLWVRRFDALAAQALPGTDGASFPFWSPESRFVGFFAQGKLKKVEATGGAPQTLCDAVLPRAGTWGRNGDIVFSANAGWQLYRTSAAGGAAKPLALDQPNQESYGPDFLPDGRHFVFFARRQKPGIYIASLDSRESKLLASQYVAVKYAGPGYLLLLAGGALSETTGTLMAQRFDDHSLQLIGEPVAIAERVAIRQRLGQGVFSVSGNGRLVYGTPSQQATQLIWMDRKGQQLTVLAKPGTYQQPAVSPDEQTVAVMLTDPLVQAQDIWLMETTRGVTTRFTSDPAAERFPVWSPDGRRIAFSSPRDGHPPSIFHKAASGTDEREELVARSDVVLQPTDWSRDGRFIVYARLDPKTQYDLWVAPAAGGAAIRDRRPIPYLATAFNEHQGHLSPDGRWMAYVSDESGRWEVYVRAFPIPGAKWQISANSGGTPTWRGDGKELFYVSAEGTLMVVTVQPEPSFKVGAPQALFRARFAAYGAGAMNPAYVPANDGRRFLINTVVEETAPSPVMVVLNWQAALRR